MNSQDKVFLGTFCVKEFSILIGLENLGQESFPLREDWDIPPPINQKMRKSSPIKVPSTKYLHSPNKSLTPPVMLLEKEFLVKYKN